MCIRDRGGTGGAGGQVSINAETIAANFKVNMPTEGGAAGNPGPSGPLGAYGTPGLGGGKKNDHKNSICADETDRNTGAKRPPMDDYPKEGPLGFAGENGALIVNGNVIDGSQYFSETNSFNNFFKEEE